MSQSNKESYKTRETYTQMFLHSCLGKLLILGGIIGVVLLFAHISIPSDKNMEEEVAGNIYKCIVSNDSLQGDKIDDAVRNFLSIFSSSADVSESEKMKEFYTYNSIKIYHHPFYSTAYIHNNFKPEGTRVGIGVFGMIIPTVSYGDFLMSAAPVRKGYNEQIIKDASFNEDEELISTPGLREYGTDESNKKRNGVRVVSE